jgi:hypothetical protein
VPTAIQTAVPAAPTTRRAATRLGRIVVHRLGAPGELAEAAPGRCAEDRREVPSRPADLVWRLAGSAPLAAGC